MINELEYKEYQRMKIAQAKRKRDQYVKRMSRIWRAKYNGPLVKTTS